MAFNFYEMDPWMDGWIDSKPFYELLTAIKTQRYKSTDTSLDIGTH